MITDTIMENIAILDAMKRDGWSDTVIDRVERSLRLISIIESLQFADKVISKEENCAHCIDKQKKSAGDKCDCPCHRKEQAITNAEGGK